MKHLIYMEKFRISAKIINFPGALQAPFSSGTL